MKDDRRLSLCWWSLLASGYLLFSGIYSYLAPCGLWMNQIFNEPVWIENDPGGFYVGAAHQLAWGQTPLFVGHPGSTLLPLLLGVQSGLYAVAGEEATSFTRFTAQHLPAVFLLSKLLMTSLHLVSFVAVYKLAHRVLRDESAAAFATLGYATSFPVLYFLSRISVEPLLVTFFALAFLATWRYQELALDHRLGRALGFSALAAGAAVSGAVTKFSFLGPLPFFLVIYILAGAQRQDPAGAIGWRVRGLALAVFVAVSLGVLTLYSQIIDWRTFYSAWDTILGGTHPSNGWTLTHFLPGLGATRIFLLSEVAFTALGVTGWVLFLSRRPAKRAQALWLSAYGAYGLLVWAYRVSLEGSFLPFHYFFLPQVLLAIFFGEFSVRVWRRLEIPSAGWRAASAGFVWIVSLHGVGAWAVVDARRNDAASYAAARAAFTLISQLGPSDRLGVELSPQSTSALRGSQHELHGMIFPSILDVRRSSLSDAFDSLFIPVPSGSLAPGAPRAFVPLLKTNVGILRDPEHERR